jgi:hypothetical protein
LQPAPLLPRNRHSHRFRRLVLSSRFWRQW